MYLDTDIALALAKEEDWLKEHVVKLNLEHAKTSVLTIIEARLVLNREYSREKALQVLDKIKKLKIGLISLDEEIIAKSQELIEKYNKIGIFDSIHAATAIVNSEELISTDSIFGEIDEVNNKDPRSLKS